MEYNQQQKSLREQIERSYVENRQVDFVTDEEVKKVYDTEVIQKAKQLRMKRIVKKNEELYVDIC